MKRDTVHFRHGFHLILGNAHSQAAEMVLKSGQSEGGPNNRHHGSDQWLFVVDGRGTAIVNGHSYPLAKGNLMLIENGDRHEIRADANHELRTLNFYVPPAYRDDNTELPAGRAD